MAFLRRSARIESIALVIVGASACFPQIQQQVFHHRDEMTGKNVTDLAFEVPRPFNGSGDGMVEYVDGAPTAHLKVQFQSSTPHVGCQTVELAIDGAATQ